MSRGGKGFANVSSVKGPPWFRSRGTVAHQRAAWDVAVLTMSPSRRAGVQSSAAPSLAPTTRQARLESAAWHSRPGAVQAVPSRDAGIPLSSPDSHRHPHRFST